MIYVIVLSIIFLLWFKIALGCIFAISDCLFQPYYNLSYMIMSEKVKASGFQQKRYKKLSPERYMPDEKKATEYTKELIKITVIFGIIFCVVLYLFKHSENYEITMLQLKIMLHSIQYKFSMFGKMIKRML